MDDGVSLKEYGVEQGMTLFIVDTDQHSMAKQLKTTTEQPKLRMEDEEYDKRTNSARVFLANLRRTKPELFNQSNENKSSSDSFESILKSLRIGTRCEVKCLGNVRGEIKWIGKRKQLNGQFLQLFI